MGCSSCPNRLSQRAMSRPCPMAAKAWDEVKLDIPSRPERPSMRTDLFARETFRPPCDIHAFQADTNGARTHENDFMTLISQMNHRFDNRRKC